MLALDKRLNLDDFADLICSDRFGPAFGRVRKKFVKCMLKGIQRKQSVNLTEIAKSLDEGIRLHATQKRLSRNLLKKPSALKYNESHHGGLIKTSW